MSTNNRLAWGVAIVAVLLPTYLIRFQIAGIPFTVLETLIVVLFGGFIWHYRFGWVRPFVRQHGWWLGVLLLASAIALQVSPTQIAALGIWKAYIIEPMLLFTVAVHALDTRPAVERVFGALGVSAAAIALLAVAQYATGWAIPEPWQALPGRRATAIYGFPNAIGLFIAPIMALWIGRFIHPATSRGAKLVALPLIGLFGLALLAARVDGAIIAVAAATVVCLLYTRLRWVTVGASVLAIAVLFWYEPTRQLLLFQDVSGDVRLALWTGTWNLLSDRPLVGAGLAGFQQLYDVYRLDSHVELLVYPHNIFFNFWAELGLLGLVWIVGVATVWAKRALRYRAIPLLSVLVTILVYGLVDVPYFKNDLAALFWIWLSVLVVWPRFWPRRT